MKNFVRELKTVKINGNSRTEKYKVRTEEIDLVIG